jgi:hypothetical protein
MTYIVERNTRFYVVAYDGLDPLTGRERRRWIPIGHDRTDAEAVAAQLDSEHDAGPPPRRTAGGSKDILIDRLDRVHRPRRAAVLKPGRR